MTLNRFTSMAMAFIDLVHAVPEYMLSATHKNRNTQQNGTASHHQPDGRAQVK
jgi:uncharacterized protein YhhL (DUF1145 family)